MSTPTATSSYTCPYCRIPSDGAGGSCPHCGAPVDVRERVTDSGWAEQPPIKDMAKIHFNRSICQISGAYVPVAEMNLSAEDWVWFSHHVLLHTDPGVTLRAMQMAGGWDRRLAGMPLIMMTAQGPGSIAFSEDAPGEIIAVPLQRNQRVEVVEHRFLVGTGAIRYTWQPSGVWFTTGDYEDEEYHYPIGRNIDVFWAEASPGLVLLHAPGNTFIRDLKYGEHILIQPSALIWKDTSVRTSLHFEYPGGAYWFTSARWQAKAAWLKLSGPGRVAIASVFEPPEVVPPVFRDSGATYHTW